MHLSLIHISHYERVPSCAYDIAGYRLDKEGVLHIPEGTEKETVEDLILQLRERGSVSYTHLKLINCIK